MSERYGGFWLRLLGVVVVIIALPFLLRGNYWQSILVVCALNAVLALSLDFILGTTGQLDLGHAAFYGIGAYVSTLLITGAGFGFWPALLLGALAAAAAGAGLALFAMKLRGHYLGIATLGFALVTYEVLVNWVSVTQGPLGIYAIPPPPAWHLPGLQTIPFDALRPLFYLVAGFAVLVALGLRSLLRSPVADALLAVREDEIGAASLGIHTGLWKVFAFGVGAGIAGAAGCFYAGFVGTLVPDSFFITESFAVLAMVVVGGAGRPGGAVAGAILLTVLPELLRGIGDLRNMVYGLLLALVVLFLPGGMSQGWANLRRLGRRAAAGT